MYKKMITKLIYIFHKAGRATQEAGDLWLDPYFINS